MRSSLVAYAYSLQTAAGHLAELDYDCCHDVHTGLTYVDAPDAAHCCFVDMVGTLGRLLLLDDATVSA